MSWHKDSRGWYYDYKVKDKKPVYYKNCWAKISGKWYHFDGQGYMQTGWLKVSGVWYYLQSSGAMVSSAWKQIKGTWYYFVGSGAMVTGWTKISGVWYFFNENGGWVENTAPANIKVTNLKLTRSKDTWTGSWKTPTDMTKGTDRGRMFQNIQTEWTLLVPDAKGTKDTAANDISVAKKLTVQTTQDTATYSAWTGKSGAWAKKKLARQALYPVTSTKVDAIRLSVYGVNYNAKGAATSITYNFALPKAPTITTSYDEKTQKFSAQIKTDAGTDTQDRYDTMYRVRAQITEGKKTSIIDVQNWKANTSTDFIYTKDIDDLKSGAGVDFASGTVVKFIVEAYARGIKGDAPSANKPVTASYTVAYPGNGEIKSIKVTSKNANGRVIVDVASPSYTSVSKLQRALNINPNVAANEIPAGSWSDVENAENNGNVEYFYDIWGEAHSDAGKYTWYRLKNENCGFTQYSAPKRADILFLPAATAANDKCKILSITPGDDGQSAVLVIGWKEDNANTGTEVSWSDDAYAWESNKPPSTFNFTWSDNPKKDTAYTGTGTIYIADLTEGSTYYFRARRYLDGDTPTYSDYSAREDVMPVTRPESVTLYAPEYVLRGEDIELTWTFASDATQKVWQVHLDGQSNTSIVAGDDARGYTSLKAEQYGGGDNVSLYVSVGTGGDLTDSNIVTVGFADAPTCRCAIDTPIVAQPTSLEVYSDSDSCGVLCTVRAAGLEYERPDGSASQLFGDVVYTDTAAFTDLEWKEVSWSSTLLYKTLSRNTTANLAELEEATNALAQLSPEDEGYEEAERYYNNAQAAYDESNSALSELAGKTYMTVFPLAYDPDFIDNGRYSIEVQTTDSITGLSSDMATCEADVSWQHQAVDPSENITIDIDQIAKVATITLVAPEGAAETDMYDVYRKISTGYVRVGDSLPLNAVIQDRYVPFARDKDLDYRICLRTADGDIAFGEYSYEFPLNTLRIDWSEDFVELPFDLVIEDSYQKDFEARGHIDGSVNGYYNNSVIKNGSYSSSTFQLDNAAQLDSLRRLAIYPRACFCRTKDGQAFQCNVNVGINQPYDSPKAEITLELTEITLTEEYMLTMSDIEGGVQDETGE